MTMTQQIFAGFVVIVAVVELFLVVFLAQRILSWQATADRLTKIIEMLVGARDGGPLDKYEKQIVDAIADRFIKKTYGLQAALDDKTIALVNLAIGGAAGGERENAAVEVCRRLAPMLFDGPLAHDPSRRWSDEARRR
jgi:hypothetical protein